MNIIIEKTNEINEHIYSPIRQTQTEKYRYIQRDTILGITKHIQYKFINMAAISWIKRKTITHTKTRIQNYTTGSWSKKTV